MLTTINTQILAALGADLGTFDLTGQVQRGRYFAPPADYDAFIGFGSPEVESEQGPTIGQFLRTITYQIDCWASVTDDTAAELTERGELLADEVLAALENARFDVTNSPGLYDMRTFVAESAVLDMDMEGMPVGWARAVIMLEVRYAVDRGL